MEGVMEEVDVHVVVCRECQASATYRPLSSGNGFTILGVSGLDVATSFAMGPSGQPMCPNDHGEMELADEQLPAGDAIERVREQIVGGALEPLQGTLPGIVPAFNYQGAYLELEEKAVEVDRLHREYDDAAAIAKDAKKAWDKAEEVYTKMALEFRRRRREKVDAGDPVTDLDTSRCTFEQLNPETDCPLCDHSIVDVEGLSIAPTNSSEHAEQAAAMLLTREIADLRDLLAAGQMAISDETVRTWSSEDRKAVRAFAEATALGATDPMPARPSVLGTMHVAANYADTIGQACTQCDAVLVPVRGEDEYLDCYEAGTLVGTDCPGRPKEAHRYPKKNKGKRRTTAVKASA